MYPNIKITKRKVSMKHAKLIYEWITEKKVIENSFVSKLVSYNDHVDYLKKIYKIQMLIIGYFI